MFAPTFTADQIRRAEQPLLAAQEADDELMQSAAHAVAEAARAMLDDAALPDDAARVLVLAGPGGNGGDGLYAGAELLLAGRRTDAFLPAGKAHERALRAFEAAGGAVLDALPEPAAGQGYALVIDALTGIGGSGALRGGLRTAAEWANASRAAVLAVDVPSGVDADTGAAGEVHVEADTTVTFGGWRRAHALSPACGAQLLADVGLPARRLHETLGDELAEWAADGPPLLLANRAVTPERTWPEDLYPMRQAPVLDIAPGPDDDKYSGGVVGIRAGSDGYPGAAVLSVAGAVNATPAMVRYAGPQAAEVVRAHPEVVATQTLEDAGRVQAWVFGPGAGTDKGAADELRWVLEQDVPVLVDADGLTLLTTHPDLRELVRGRAQ
ncbi:NAD(P)H-hydrate epimerase, partial [Corynebacterium jeddahense]